MITISGVIGQDFTYSNFVAALANEKEKTIQVELNSVGGYVDVGLMIFDELENLKKQGRFIITRAVNECMSIASVIFMAGNSRLAGCDLMIHNPWIDGVTGDSRTLQSVTKELAALEKDLEKIYANVAKVDRETVSRLMDIESYITPAEAVTMGFATGILPLAVKNQREKAKGKAKAIFNNKKIERKMSKHSTTLAALRKKVLALIGGEKNLTFTTVEQVELVIQREDGEPEVGDAASPDGTHTLENGDIITVESGVITAIVKAGGGEEPTIEEVSDLLVEAMEINDQLEAENEELRENQNTPENKAILDKVKAAGGIEKLLKGQGAGRSTYVPPTRTGMRKQDGEKLGVTSIDDIKEKINARKKGGNK